MWGERGGAKHVPLESANSALISFAGEATTFVAARNMRPAASMIDRTLILRI